MFGNKSDEVEEHRFVNYRLRKIDYTWQPQAGAGPSITIATEKLRNLICRVGESTDEITEKSVKMGWVT